MKPISDKWIENWASRRFADGDAKAAVKLARELQRTRAAIREWSAGEISQFDMLRTTLPEGGK